MCGNCEFRTVVYQGIEYKDLEISPCGIMRNRNSGNIYAWTVGDSGYMCAMYSLSRHNKKRMKQHRVLMETFVPNPENKPFINHIDGNKRNNNLSNLEWCTHKENVDHAVRIGLIEWGEHSYNSKLTEKDVVFIRQNYKKGDEKYGFAALARKFGVDKTTVRDVYYRKTWKHLESEYGEQE